MNRHTTSFHPPRPRHIIAGLGCVLLSLWLAGCATTPGGGSVSQIDHNAQLVNAHQAIQQGRPEAAVPLLETLLQDSATPANIRPQAWANLGVAQIRLNHPEAAVTALEKAAKLAPKNATIAFDLGLAYRKAGRLNEALKSYQASLGIDPNQPAVLYNMGILYDLYLQQPKDAIKVYQRYVQLAGPHTPQVQGWIEALAKKKRK